MCILATGAAAMVDVFCRKHVGREVLKSYRNFQERGEFERCEMGIKLIYTALQYTTLHNYRAIQTTI